MSREHPTPMIICACAAGVVAMMGAAFTAPALPDDFRWTGSSQPTNDNWDDANNWENLSSGERDWPSQDGEDEPWDSAAIDDTNPQATVEQNVSAFTPNLFNLTIGDDHTLNLTRPIWVRGVLQCDGEVTLTGANNLTVYGEGVMRIYAEEDTTIQFTSGGGALLAG